MIKKRAVYIFLRSKQCDIIFLQETHCHLKKEEFRWGKEWEGQNYWSKGTSHSKGVAILFNSKLILLLGLYPSNGCMYKVFIVLLKSNVMNNTTRSFGKISMLID